MYYNDNGSSSNLFAFLFTTQYLAFLLVIAIFSILIFWKIFQKFGEPGWKSIIPIYNLYIMCKYILGSGLWMLGFIVPILNIIVAIMFAIKMAQVFGKGTLFAIGLIFFPTIFQAIIAFGESTYNPSK